MFSDELEHISWEETTARIHAKTDADVRRALSKEHCNVEDFMALISPAAAPYLETMARLSKKYTEARFGKTISMFVPLYITNSCTNSCVYCGFHISNPMPRTILTEEEIVNEYKAIKKLKTFREFAVGDRRKSGQSRRALHSPCTGPGKTLLQQSENRSDALKNGRVCNAERTRHEWRDLFSGNLPQGELQHLPPPWHEVQIRMACQWFRPHGAGRRPFHRHGSAHRSGERMADRHHHDGLSPALSPETLLANEIQRQLPRMRPSENGGFQPNVIMSDRELAQVTFAMRIFDHDVDISYSTREPADIRDHMATLGVTTMSAESKTEPGGYYSYPQTLEQFHVSDERKAVEVDSIETPGARTSVERLGCEF